MRPPPWALLPALVLLALALASIASSGDRHPSFQKCVENCYAEDCADDATRKQARERSDLQEVVSQMLLNGEVNDATDEATLHRLIHEQLDRLRAGNSSSEDDGPLQLPFVLRALRWTCDENCAYECMHAHTEMRVERNESVLQYYGKWPFVRLWGMQEPASVFFSLVNMAVHATYYRWFRRKAPSDLPFRRIYMLSAAANMNAWLWSAVFHCRDTPLTEKLDYFSAGLVVLSALYAALLRLHNAWNCPRLLGYSFVLLYIVHISYLSFGRFDYGYNMTANVVVGVLHSLTWAAWAARTRRPYSWMLVTALVGLHAAVALELGDFPPLWFILDAHALWHAVTPPLAVLWYRFLQADARFEADLRAKAA